MAQLSTTRRLKVSPHYTRLHPSLKITASLRLTGDWLLHAGFRPGDVVAVEVEPGQLRITRTHE